MRGGGEDFSIQFQRGEEEMVVADFVIDALKAVLWFEAIISLVAGEMDLPAVIVIRPSFYRSSNEAR